MSRHYDGSSSYHQTTSGAPVTNYPYSMSCWINCDTSTTEQRAVSVGQNNSNGWIALSVQSDDTVRLHVDPDFGSAATPTTTETITDGTWHFIAGVSSASNNHDVYLDGSTQTANSSSSITFPTLDRLTVGALGRNTIAQYFDGKVAHLCFWDGHALSTTEIDLLASGVSPLVISPDLISWYAPMHSGTGNIVPQVGTLVPTITNTVTGAESPIVTLPWTLDAHLSAAVGGGGTFKPPSGLGLLGVGV